MKVCAAVSMLTLGLLSGACIFSDPGWSYVSPDGRPVRDDGVRYQLPRRADLDSRVYASFFSASLSVELDIENASTIPLSVDVNSLVVQDDHGISLVKRADLPTARCGGRANAGTCELEIGRAHV